MKRIISALIVCILVLGCVVTFASCKDNSLSGTYTSEAGVTSIAFSEKSAVIMISFSVGDFYSSSTYEANYKIKGGNIVFSYDKDQKKYEQLNGKYDFELGEESGKEYIKIDGIKYTKQ